MLWDKTKYEFKLSRGRGRVVTSGMHGLIQHLIIVPNRPETIWSAIISDSQDDVIYQAIDHEGRLDDFRGVPVGRDKPEQLRIDIFDATFNDKFDAIFKVREVR